jgi:hypothetical protein
MAPPSDLKDKLRKIEALIAGAGTGGERLAAEAARERIQARLADERVSEAEVEVRFSIPDPWARMLFVALCRRYGLRPFRYRRMHRQSIVVKAPESFMEGVLWPEFEELSAVLTDYLAEITDRVIREAVHGETGEAEVVEQLG